MPACFYLQVADVVNENTRICAPVECDTQTLESLLPCSIPNLGGRQRVNTEYACACFWKWLAFLLAATYLHRDQFIINHDFLGEKIGSNSGFVLISKLLRYILIHKRSFSDPMVVGMHIYMIRAQVRQQNVFDRLSAVTIYVKATPTHYPREWWL